MITTIPPDDNQVRMYLSSSWGSLSLLSSEKIWLHVTKRYVSLCVGGSKGKAGKQLKCIPEKTDT